MQEIQKYPSPNDILPHNKPMLLVDKIENYEYNKFLVASTIFQANDYFFQGHFEGNPIVPGVILVESMFQTCGLYLRLSAEFSPEFRIIQGRAIKIKNASFNQEVKPNQELKIYVHFKHRMMNFFVFDSEIRVDNKIVCKSELVLA